jgi:pimeloyl-ACP methyl ester carboxylesterase
MLLLTRAGSRGRSGSRRLGFVLLLAVLLGGLLAGCSLSLPGKTSDPVPVAPSARTSAPPSRDPAEQPRFAAYYAQKASWSDCGGGFDCTKVTVPVDWAQPAGGTTIELAVIRRKATGSRIGSLLINPGGPGVSGVDWVRSSSRAYGAALRASFDLIGWDPRGIGQSSPIECLPNSMLDAYTSMDATPDTEAERAALEHESQVFAAGCKQRTGPVLAHVDTLSTVKDMDVIRAVLGDRTLSYFGASYGTFLGAWYAQTFPWRAGRLVLDGAVDPALTAQGYDEGQTVGFSRALDAYVKDCLSQQNCPLRGSPEQAKAELGQIIDRADSSPLNTQQGRPLTQSLMTTGIIQGMYSQQLWSRLSQALTKALQGDGTGLLEMADEYLQRDKNGQYAQTLQATTPIYCLDHPETRSVDQIAADAVELARRYPPLGATVGWSATACAEWPYKAVLTPQKLTAGGAAPILVVGSTGDPATPYEWAKALASQLSSGRLLTREGFGHTAYFEGSTCIDDAIERYLVSGTLPAQGTVCS